MKTYFNFKIKIFKKETFEKILFFNNFLKITIYFLNKYKIIIKIHFQI